MKIHLVQLLCPKRHCILAGVYQDGRSTTEAVIEDMKRGVKKLRINPWCGICGSTELRYEDQIMEFASAEEASTFLIDCQERQLETARILAMLPKDN